MRKYFVRVFVRQWDYAEQLSLRATQYIPREVNHLHSSPQIFISFSASNIMLLTETSVL
nr:MAG TPA: hypothetical protein [Caudoviricetes sp.]